MSGPGGTFTDVVGIVPAGGEGKRIAPLPCSKEIYPVGFSKVAGATEERPKAACQYLLEKMRLAGVSKAYIILRAGKWDIPSYLGDGKTLDMHLAYLMVDHSNGPPYTLNQAYPFVKDCGVAFGFPDILFRPDNVFVRLLTQQQQENADVLLGLFPAEQPTGVDMIDVDEKGQVKGIVAKPSRTHLLYTWAAAVWTPVFSKFLGEFVASHEKLAPNAPEPSVGDVIHSAVTHNLNIKALVVSDEPYLDIGTPQGLLEGVKRFALQTNS